MSLNPYSHPNTRDALFAVDRALSARLTEVEDVLTDLAKQVANLTEALEDLRIEVDMNVRLLSERLQEHSHE